MDKSSKPSTCYRNESSLTETRRTIIDWNLFRGKPTSTAKIKSERKAPSTDCDLRPSSTCRVDWNLFRDKPTSTAKIKSERKAPSADCDLRPSSTCRVDWNLYRQQGLSENTVAVDPAPKRFAIEVEVHSEPTDEGFEAFRQLSHKVARVRYDIPWNHSIAIAFAMMSGSSQSRQAVGVLVFKLADGSHTNPESQDFMDDYFHQIGFIFVDKDFQRSGVGSSLMNSAITSMKASGIHRQLHLEGSKTAVKFFRKLGFTRKGKMQKASCKQGSSIFWSYFNMHLQI